MRSATSYFKLSGAVIKDDIRRFWAIPVIGFIFYFFSCLIYILLNMKENSLALPGYIENLLSGSYAPSMLNICWMSVLSVLLVFRYLHNSGHTVAVHSQPFTRAELMNSHVMSCVIFVALPILLTGIILLIIAHPVYYSQDYYFYRNEMVNVFARVNILRWMWESFICALFIIMVSVIGGMVTGTSFHHAVAALGFNVVAPLCSWLLTLYGGIYLFGYVQPDWVLTAVRHMSPSLDVAFDTSFLSAFDSAYFVVFVVLLYIFAMFLYYRRRLERATDGIVFKAFDVLITFIFGYLGMTALGMAFYAIFDHSTAVTTLGYIAGALLGIVIVRMVILKSVRIFNKSTGIILGSYLVVALVFFGCLNFNVTGYESWVDEDADLISVSFGYGDTYAERLLHNVKASDDESKAAAIALHKMIIENKAECTNVGGYDSVYAYTDNRVYEDTIAVNIRYMKDAGTEDSGERTFENTIKRNYNVPVYLLLGSDELKTLTDTDAVKKQVADEMPAAEDVQYAYIESGRYYSSSPYGVNNAESDICNDRAQLAGLMAALKKDAEEMIFDEMKSAYDTMTLAHIEINYTAVQNGTAAQTASGSDDDTMLIAKELSESVSGSDQELSTFEVNVKSTYKNTIAWLNANGYGDLIQYDASTWKYAVVYDVEASAPVNSDRSYSYDTIPQSEDGMQVITDSALIRKLFEGATSHAVIGPLSKLSTSENNIYLVEFYTSDSYDGGAYYNAYNAYIDGSLLK